MADYVREFGTIERIIELSYINGQFYKTRFEMKMFDQKKGNFTENRNQYDFLGAIPEEYVGMDVMYFSITEKDQLTDTQIEVGRITSRGRGDPVRYDIKYEKSDPKIPDRIYGRFKD